MQTLRRLCAGHALSVAAKMTSAGQHISDAVAKDLRDDSVRSVGLAEQSASYLAAPGVQFREVEDAIVPLQLRRFEHGLALSVRYPQTNEVQGVEVLRS